jgi:phosphonate transport system ATP-binding protein
MVYQQYHLVENLAVIHNVNAGCLGHWPLWKALWSLMWPQNVANVQQVLNLVGLPEKLRTRTGVLSGGQQQRVALARVIVQNPAVILADEPISNLDRERSQALMDLLRNLVVQANRTLVVSLHAIEFVSTHFQRVIGLRHGRVLWDMPAETLTATHIEQLYSLK